PVVMSGNVFMNISGGTALNMSGGLSIAAGKTATMTSSGSLEIRGPQNHGAGSTLNVASGHVKFSSNAGTPGTASTAANAGLAIRVSGDGSVVLNSDQDLASIRVDFDVAGDQSFDLASPPGAGQFRSVRVYASDLASAKTSLYGAIITANAGGAGNSKDGIFDSGLATHFGMKLGIAQLTDAHGDAYLLIRPTRSGDLNLDGVVSISDFLALASNFGSGNATWGEGDLNYDGQVSISDFIDLASNFNGSYSGQTFPISAADAPTLSAFAEAHGAVVPEPAMMGLLGGAVMMLAGRGGKTVYFKAYGNRAVQPAIALMTADTIFDLASLSKCVGCAPSIMILAERAKLKLSDPVAKYIPAFAANGKEKITIEDLLLHRGHLIPDNDIEDYKDGPAAAWEKIFALRPTKLPLRHFVYSDMGYIVLGKLVEVVDGRRLDVFAREESCTPLQMQHTADNL